MQRRAANVAAIEQKVAASDASISALKQKLAAAKLTASARTSQKNVRARDRRGGDVGCGEDGGVGAHTFIHRPGGHLPSMMCPSRQTAHHTPSIKCPANSIPGWRVH